MPDLARFSFGCGARLARIRAPAGDSLVALQEPRIAHRAAGTSMAIDAGFLIGGIFGNERACSVSNNLQDRKGSRTRVASRGHQLRIR